jgi:MYXO-CTERM domain-containing protein
MKKINQCMFAAILCVFLTGNAPLAAQDASHPQTATSQDSSDWGLLGLIGLIGLLGLRKKKEPED